MIIRRYTAYNSETGEIVSSFSGDETNAQANTPEGCILVDGQYSHMQGYFSNGVLVDYTPDQIAAKRERPSYPAIWDNAAMHWVDKRPIIEVEKDVRTKRAALLSDSDWTALADVPLSQQQRLDWAAYRQALRNVTNQSGFPIDIIWPVSPV